MWYANNVDRERKQIGMSTVQIVSEVKIDLDKVLDGMAQLELTELERVAFHVNSLVARRKAPSLPRREAELLQQINDGLPATVRERYKVLHEKLLDETITPEEHQEFGALVDQIEQVDAERLQHLIELAQLRNVSLDTLMEQLGIQRSRYA